MKRMVVRTAWIFLLATAVACAPSEPKSYDNEDSETGSQGAVVGAGGSGASAGRQLVTVGVSLVDGDAKGFALAPADAYTVDLEDCASGYSSSADENSTALEVYKYDVGCKAKLSAFTVGLISYVPTAGDPFTTWDDGDTATFDEAGEPGTNAVTVTVISQLDDPVSGTESIVYQFSELIKGADSSIAELILGDSHTITTESQDPPNFTIDTIDFVNVTAQGAGEFTFLMECAALLVGTVCDNVDMADITYKLVEDTYGSTMVIGDAHALFDGSEESITVGVDNHAAATDTLNGGFITVTMTGPDQMATNPNMILILQAGGASYQYFNVDVSTLTQD